MPTKASIVSADINRAITQAMDGNKEGAKVLQNLLKDPNPQIRTRTADRLNRARESEETRIDNGLSRMGNLSVREGELQLIIKVAQRTAHTLDEKTAITAFLGARNERIRDEEDRRKRYEEKMAHAKEEEPQRTISWNAYAFRGPTIKAKMQQAVDKCGVKTIEDKLLPEAIANNFHHHMDERTQNEVIHWLTKELQKRKGETVMGKIKKRIRG